MPPGSRACSPSYSAPRGTPHLAPPGELSGTLGDTRRWESRTAPLADAKAAGRAFGATVNDVVLAAVAAGFRAVLLSRGDVPADRRLRVMVPVSLRRPGDTATDNQVSAVTVPLPVGRADPVDRLAEVAATTRRLKDVGAPALGVALLGAVDTLVPAAVQDVAVGYGAAVPEWFVEGVVTNVPGPQFPLWVLGRRVRTLTPTIPLGGNLRLIVGVLSFDGDIDIGVTGDGVDPAAVRTLADGIARGITELRERAGG